MYNKGVVVMLDYHHHPFVHLCDCIWISNSSWKTMTFPLAPPSSKRSWLNFTRPASRRTNISISRIKRTLRAHWFKELYHSTELYKEFWYGFVLRNYITDLLLRRYIYCRNISWNEITEYQRFTLQNYTTDLYHGIILWNHVQNCITELDYGIVLRNHIVG